MTSKYLYTIITIARMLARRSLRDKTSLFFYIVFPLIFLVIFGGLFGNSSTSFKIDVINQSSQASSKTFISILQKSNIFKVTSSDSLSNSENMLDRSQIDGVLVLPPNFGALNKQGIPGGNVKVYYDQSDEQTASAIQTGINGLLTGVNTSLTHYKPPITVSEVATNSRGQTYFDFIFSGMLGFTIVILGLLGPSRSIPEFKKLGILRRLHTTPISSIQYVLASLLSSIVIGFLSIAVMFFVGFHFYHLHMIGSYSNLIIFLIISIVAIYGFGLAIGGWAKSEERGAPLTNLVSFPMMFLSGTFFPTYLMPLWLQNIAKFLPLTPVIEGLREIISQGKTILNLGPQLLLIGVWIIIIYVVAFTVFSWE
jgi:ABC-2 type transport system permease protein